MISRAIRSFKHRYGKWRNKLNLKAAKVSNSYIDKQALIYEFNRLGIGQGDQIIVHSAMSKLGPLKNGASTFIDALIEVIGESGLIVMPTHSMTRMYEYLSDKNVSFDVNNTPSTTGALTELFRKYPKVFRSIHPTHSLAAWGNGAKEFIQGHENSLKPFDQHSPYPKIINFNLKVLAIGLNLNSTTLIRAADDLVENFPFNPYAPEIFKVPCTDANGQMLVVKTYSHRNDLYLYRDNMRLFKYLKEHIKIDKLGKAEIMLYRAKTIFNIQKDLAVKGITTYKTV